MEISNTLKEDLWKFYLTHEEFQEAIAIASPSLHRSLSLLKNQFSLQAFNPVFLSILKYFLRMCSRTTPFGLFSYVGWGMFKEESALTFDYSSIKKKIKPDSEWTQFLVQEVEEKPLLFPHLRIMTNPNIIKKNERFCVFKKRDLKNAKSLTSIKRTPFSEAALSLAKTPLMMCELEEKLISLFKEHEAEKITEGLRQIFQETFLISEISIRPDCPYQFIDFIRSHSPFPKEKQMILEEIVKGMEAYEKTDLNSGIRLLNQLLEKSETLKKVEYPLQVDSILESDQIFLNKKIQEEISEAATILWSITNQENPADILQEYRSDFLEKYGPFRLVPLLDLADEITPLVLASKQKDFVSTHHPLHKLLFENFENEVILDRKIQDLFKFDAQTIAKAPSSLEIYFDILADSSEDIDQGRYTIALNPVIGSTQAGNTFRRFLFSLENKESKIKSLKEFLKKEEALFESAVFVEASFSPENHRTANVCFFEKIRDFQLPLHYHEKGEHIVSLEDIYVGCNQDRFYLYSQKLKKEIYVTLSSAVNPDLAPPLLNFILSVSSSHFHFFSPYVWHKIGYRIETLPRLKYKNVILCPARWFFDSASLGVSENIQRHSLENILVSNFEKKRVPDKVFLTHFDHRLLVNWKNQDHLKLIAQHFLRTKEICLFEALSSSATQPLKGNLGSHAAEFVLPLIKKSSYPIPTQLHDFPSFKPYLPNERMSIFQNNWTYAKLFLPEEEEFSFITNHLSLFIHQLSEKKLIDKWFYIRYKQKHSHIRLRLHGSKASASLIIENLIDWVSNLISHHVLSDFSLHVYDRELERYGGTDCIVEAEDVFVSDSKAALYMMNIFKATGEAIPLVGLSSFVIIHYLHAFLDHNIEKMIDILKSNQADHQLLAGSRQHIKFLSPYTRNLFFNSDPSSDKTDFSFHFREAISSVISSLQIYRNKIERLEEKKELASSKESILNSLIHMHCNRLLGIDPVEENKSRLMACHILQGIHQQMKKLDYANELR